jgi:hypothetical protein
VEIFYCSRCGRQVPPGGIHEGRYYLVKDEPVCMDCAEGMSESELSASTILEVPTEERERKRSTTKLVAHVGGPDREEPPPEMLDTRPKRRASGRAVRMAVLLLFLAAAVAAAVIWMRGGTPELPPPPVRPAPPPPPKDVAPVRLFPEADGYFKKAGRSPQEFSNVFVSHKGDEEYCLRFDLSRVGRPTKQAVLVLHVIWLRTDADGGFKPELTLLESNTWKPDRVLWARRPTRGRSIGRVPVAVGDVEVDVTAAVNAALGSGRKISLRLHAASPSPESKQRVKFAGRKNSDSAQHPRLKLTY